MTENNKLKKKQGKERSKSARAWQNIYRSPVVVRAREHFSNSGSGRDCSTCTPCLLALHCVQAAKAAPGEISH